MANDRDPLLTNDRARREWAWICKCVGEATAIAAIGRLKGNRKPFPLNIARVLDLSLPEEKYLPALPGEAEQIHEKSRKVLGDAMRMLTGKSGAR